MLSKAKPIYLSFFGGLKRIEKERKFFRKEGIYTETGMKESCLGRERIEKELLESLVGWCGIPVLE